MTRRRTESHRGRFGMVGELRVIRELTKFPDTGGDCFRIADLNPKTIRELIVTSAFIDADHKLISNQKARDSQYTVSCSSIAGMRRRS